MVGADAINKANELKYLFYITYDINNIFLSVIKMWRHKWGKLDSRIHEWMKDCHELWSVEKLVINWWQANYTPPTRPSIHHLVISNWSKLRCVRRLRSIPTSHLLHTAAVACLEMYTLPAGSELKILQQLFLQSLLPFCGVGKNKLPFSHHKSWRWDRPQGERGFLRISEAGEKLRSARAAGGCSGCLMILRVLLSRSPSIYTNPCWRHPF